MKIPMLLAAGAALVSAQPQASPVDFLNHGRPVLNAHNCYPYEGQWADRIGRALRRPVVTHAPKTTGSEPSLRNHFFERVRPSVEKAPAQNDRGHWPLIILPFDFRSLDPNLLLAVWDLLGEYQSWITTAPQTSDPRELAPFDPKPLLVITEDADVQEQVFFLFGSAQTAKIAGATCAKRQRLAATLPPDQLLTGPPTNYRRLWNHSWDEVEEGGQTKGGNCTPADAAGSRPSSIARTISLTGSASTPSTASAPSRTAAGARATTSVPSRVPKCVGKRPRCRCPLHRHRSI